MWFRRGGGGSGTVRARCRFVGWGGSEVRFKRLGFFGGLGGGGVGVPRFRGRKVLFSEGGWEVPVCFGFGFEAISRMRRSCGSGSGSGGARYDP